MSGEMEETAVCELCDTRHPVELTTTTDDGCYMCPACSARATEAFKACTHEWKPSHNQYGDEAHVCDRCSHIVADEDFPALFGHPAPGQAGEVA